MMTRKERFQKVYAYLFGEGLIKSKQNLADIIECTRPTLSKAYNGDESYLTNGLLKKINAAFPGIFNLDWLLNGDGEMLKAPQMAQDARIPYGVESTPPDTLQMLVEQNTRLLDMIAQKDAKIEQLQKELDEMRGVSYPAKKSG